MSRCATAGLRWESSVGWPKEGETIKNARVCLNGAFSTNGHCSQQKANPAAGALSDDNYRDDIFLLSLDLFLLNPARVRPRLLLWVL